MGDVRRRKGGQKGKEKEKGKGKKGKKEKKRTKRGGGGGGKEISVFFSSTFRRLELIGVRSKFCIFNEGHAQRGRDSSYFSLFPP